MSAPEFAQLEILAQLDDLMSRLRTWSEGDSAWESLNRCRAMTRRLLPRIETLRIRLEAPLVVAAFGGTGTGKSALVNALVGQECTTSGKQRPTTRQPVLIAHSNTEIEALGLSIEDFHVVRMDASILRDIVIVDCPDPDTSESDDSGSNLSILRQVLPFCDVLIYTSTQQKYKSARVGQELIQSAVGCQLFFVQTHGDTDEDIREDWRQTLEKHYQVPEVFFVDSLHALQEQQAGRRPSGEFARLQDRITTQLAASQRARIRRANLVDLLQDVLSHCRKELESAQPQVDQLEQGLREQCDSLKSHMADQLRDELLKSENLWERRLLSSVTDVWGFSPFSAMLRLYNGIGAAIASFSFFRARTSAQMALVGILQGRRWVESWRKQKQSDSSLEEVGRLGLDDAVLHEAQVIIEGHTQAAGLDSRFAADVTLDELRHEAARVQDRFMGDAGRKVDALIERLALRNSGPIVRCLYEAWFLSYLMFILFRVGKNFFYDSFLAGLLGRTAHNTALLTVDFYVPAALFFLLWSGMLVMLFTRRLRRGLRTEIRQLADQLVRSRIPTGLFPDLESACRAFEFDGKQLGGIADSARVLRRNMAGGTDLGRQRTNG